MTEVLSTIAARGGIARRGGGVEGHAAYARRTRQVGVRRAAVTAYIDGPAETGCVGVGG